MINIQEILKKVQIGTKLYSPLLGECTLKTIDPIKVMARNENCYTLTRYGTYSISGIEDAECILFPSKNNRDWSNIEQLLLSQYSTETLRAELKRRNAEEKKLRQKEFDNAHRCRNCIYFDKESNPLLHNNICKVRTWGKNIKRHYVVNGSHGLQCKEFIHK